MSNKNTDLVSIALVLLLGFVVGCDMRESTPTVFSSPTPFVQLPATSSAVPAATNISCWEDWEETKAKDAFECALKKYFEDVEENPSIADNHFRLGVLYWENGDKVLGREEIINAIRLDVLNESYLEYLFSEVIPMPAQVDIENPEFLYDEQFSTPYFQVSGENVTQFDVEESHVPANVAVGASSIQVEWQKESGAWASLVFGFDPEIENRQKALEGSFISLGGLNSSNLDEYALAFRLKGKDIQGSPDLYNELRNTLIIKFQDQNLAIRESVGNQVFHQVDITNLWEEHLIPLNKFYFDEQWITELVCPYEIDFIACRNSPLFYFDWSRVKQINFDVPFFSTSGVIYLDDIKIIHLD